MTGSKFKIWLASFADFYGRFFSLVYKLSRNDDQLPRGMLWLIITQVGYAGILLVRATLVAIGFVLCHILALLFPVVWLFFGVFILPVMAAFSSWMPVDGK